MALDDKAKSLLDFISHCEGADYQTMYGGTKVDLSKKTVQDVITFNRAWGKSHGSSATGKYQIMNATLAGMAAAGVCKLTDLFTNDLQDLLGYTLLKRRGYEDYRAGKLSASTFALNIAKEWASLPTPAGKSYYDGDGVNHALTTYAKLMAAVKAAA